MRNSLQLCLVCTLLAEIYPQCYIDSDIAIYQGQYPDNLYQEDSNQCLANFTLVNENLIDVEDDYTVILAKGINCSRKDSFAMSGTWTYESDGSVINCDNNTGDVRCMRQPGSVTLYAAFDRSGHPNGVYTCCIEELCISIRIYQAVDFESVVSSKVSTAVIESCSVIPPSDITVIPQQYIVQMITSGVPPSRLTSFIKGCTDGDGVTCGTSYYSLIDLKKERYQFSLPVTWSTNTNYNKHNYNCEARLGGFGGTSRPSVLLSPKIEIASIKAPSTPNVSYEILGATTVQIHWTITGEVNGFIVNQTIELAFSRIHQLSNGSTRKLTIEGLLSERNYTFEVRGYYELLGPPGITTVRLEAGISSLNGSLLSVSDDFCTQQIQVNCYTTTTVQPHEITWTIGSDLIESNSYYQVTNGSDLLESVQLYRHYITVTGSFSNGTVITCSIIRNGRSSSEDYVIQAASSPPTEVDTTILSSSGLSICWSSLSDVTGYIIQYTGGKPRLVNGGGILCDSLEGLTQGRRYQISVYSYKDLPSKSSSQISVLLDVPLITSYEVQAINSTAVMMSWDISSSVIDNYTLLYTRLCDNVEGSMLIEGGALNNMTVSNLFPGVQYFISITPVNALGKGMERTENVTLERNVCELQLNNSSLAAGTDYVMLEKNDCEFSTTTFLAGAVSTSAIIIILLVLLVLQTVWIVHIRWILSRKQDEANTTGDTSLYETIKDSIPNSNRKPSQKPEKADEDYATNTQVVNVAPPWDSNGKLTDTIEMQACGPYSLHKFPCQYGVSLPDAGRPYENT